jgi:hypothetical protein
LCVALNPRPSRPRASFAQRVLVSRNVGEQSVRATAGRAVEKGAPHPAGITVNPDDLAGVVDPACLGAHGRGIGHGSVGTAVRIIDKSAEALRAVGISPDDLASVIDPPYKGVRGRGMIDGGVSATAKKKAVIVAAAVNVSPGDLSGVVDPACKGAEGRGVFDRGGVETVDVKEAARAKRTVRVVVSPDDVARSVDACCRGPLRSGRGIIEGGIKTIDVEEAVGFEEIGVHILAGPDDVARSVDASWGCELRIGDLQGRVGATAVEEATRAAVGDIPPDDVARSVDAAWVRGEGGSQTRGEALIAKHAVKKQRVDRDRTAAS